MFKIKTGCYRQYYRDKPTLDNNNNKATKTQITIIVNRSNINSKQQDKQETIWKKNDEIMVPLKYLSKF